jgi:NTP pyrophosphatase (non-canonical NTP hydrolase)
MDFQEYQDKSKVTAIYPNFDAEVYHKHRNLIYTTFGLMGETGEVVEKIKKLFRDDAGEISEARKQELVKELGDVLWYVSQIATELGVSLEEVIQQNIEKIYSRKDRGVIQGDGDNR